MSQVAELGWQIVQGRRGADVFRQNPDGWVGSGYCLSLTRQVTDVALGISTYSYAPNATRSPIGITPAWAARGLAVSEAMPGDMLMQETGSRGFGHTAIYLGAIPGDPSGTKYILENTWSNRGRVIHGAVRFTPLSQFGVITRVIRFPQDNKTDADRRQAFNPGTPPSSGPAEPAPVGGGGGGTPANPTTPPKQGGGVVQGAIDIVSNLVDPAKATYDGGPDQTLFVYNAVGEETQKRAPGVELTNIGGVNSLVVLRKHAQDELDFAMPFVGPLSIAVEDSWNVFRQHWANLKAKWGEYENWGRYYEPVYNLADPDNHVYRWALPGITSINLRQTAEGTSVAEIEMRIDDHEPAEMVLSSLMMTQRYKNLLVEVWLPVTYHDDASDKDSERMVVEPMFVGMIEEVTASPWPHTISFRVIPQDRMMNLRGLGDMPGFTGHFEGKPAYEVIGEIGNAYKMLFYSPNIPSLKELLDATDGVGQIGLSKIKPLQQSLGTFDTYMQPPLDVVRQIVEQRNLKMQRLLGFEVFGKRIFGIMPRAVYLIYDPTTWNPFTKEYWNNTAWGVFFKPLADLISPGHEAVGNLAVFYPHNMAINPERVKLIASALDTFGTDDARENKYAVLIEKLFGIARSLNMGTGGGVQGAYESQTHNVLVEFLDDLWGHDGTLSRVSKAMCPVLEVENLTARTPTESELTNPLYGTDVGSGTQYHSISAENAAKLMHVSQQPDGSFQLFTASGEQRFEHKDQVYLKYTPNMSRPYTVVPAVTEIAESGRFYPFTLTLRVKPSHGVRTGMMGALVGFGRTDGIWEVYQVEHVLDSSGASMVVTLRCMRDLYLH